MDWVFSESPFAIMVPVKKYSVIEKQVELLKDISFKRRWVGYSTAKTTYTIKDSKFVPYYLFIERNGERKEDYSYNTFLCTSDRDELEAMALNFPDRWHIEEFFKHYQDLGWKRFGTMNLNIQYGKMTMTLITQSVIYMMRERIGYPFTDWDSKHLSKDFFKGLVGDIRVNGDTIVVTYYNAPNYNSLKIHFENMPEKLQSEGVNPSVPWLYNFKLDFRFK